MKNKHLTTGLIVLSTIASFMVAPLTASAAYNPISRQLCDLAIFPFDLAATALYGSSATPYINGKAAEFPGGTITDFICKNHLTIPGSTPYTAQSYNHNPVTDTGDIPLKSGAQNHYVPIGKHEHYYYNDSYEETSGQQYFYKSYVAKFAIDFAPDVAQNIDLNNITCITDLPPGWGGSVAAIADCDGYVPGLWGGTTVSKSASGVVWTFGIDTPGDKPRIFGKNPDLDPIIGGGFNSNLDVNREFFGKVQLPTKTNIAADLWSSTTTSRVLIRDFAIKKTTDLSKLNENKFCSVAGDYTYWCSVDNQVPSSYQKDYPYGGSKANYHWFPIGTTAVVWRKSNTPPAVCTSLTVTADTAKYNATAHTLEANTDTTFTVTPNFSGAGTPPDLDYKWEATSNGSAQVMEANMLAALVQSNVQSSSNVNLGTPVQNFTILDPGTFEDFKNSTSKGNPYTDRDSDNGSPANDVQTYYTGGSAGTHITVKAVLKGTNTVVGGGCDGYLDVVAPPEVPDCTNLTITPSTTTYQDTDLPKNITVTPTTKGGLALDYKWTASIPGLINFDGNSSTYYDTNTNTNLTKTGPITSPVTVTVTGVNKANYNQEFPSTCQKTITFTPSGGNVCTNLQILRNGTPISGSTLNVGDSTNGLTVSVIAPGKNVNTDLDYLWSATPDGSFNGVASGNPATTDKPSDVENYTGGGNGTVVSVTAINPATKEPQSGCSASFNMTQQQQNNVCSNLNLNYVGSTVSGGASQFLTANPQNTNPPPPANVTWTLTGNGALINNTFGPWPNGTPLCPSLYSPGSMQVPAACQYYYQTSSVQGTKGSVHIEASPNLGSKDACRRDISYNNPPQNSQCNSLSSTPYVNGGYCVQPNPSSYSDTYRWYLSDGTNVTNGTCYAPPSGLFITKVEAVSSPNSCNIPFQPQPPVCQNVSPSYDINTNELCLNPSPANNYNGQFNWTINGTNVYTNGDSCEHVPLGATVNVNGPNSCDISNYKTPPSRRTSPKRSRQPRLRKKATA